MKKIFFVAIILLSTFSFLKAQTASENKNKIYDFVEQMPEYIGGYDSMSVFLQKNLKYPVQAKKDSLQGKVSVQFIVDTIGVIEDVKIKKSLSKECDEEVIRVMLLMPPWKPGMLNGKPVNVRFLLPIIFKLKD